MPQHCNALLPNVLPYFPSMLDSARISNVSCCIVAIDNSITFSLRGGCLIEERAIKQRDEPEGIREKNINFIAFWKRIYMINVIMTFIESREVVL